MLIRIFAGTPFATNCSGSVESPCENCASPAATMVRAGGPPSVMRIFNASPFAAAKPRSSATTFGRYVRSIEPNATATGVDVAARAGCGT